MTVSFKQFSTFISQAEGVNAPEQLDEIWAKIMGKKQEDSDEKDRKTYGKVLTAKEKAELKKKEIADAEEARKKALRDKRDAEWAKAKERTELSTRRTPGKGEHRSQEVGWHNSFNEGQEHFDRKDQWEKAANAAGLKVKKLNDNKWGAFKDDEKVGELKDLGSRFDGWLVTEEE
jgi:hypothetical protein